MIDGFLWGTLVLVADKPRKMQQQLLGERERESIENIEQNRISDAYPKTAIKDKSAKDRRKRSLMIFGKDGYSSQVVRHDVEHLWKPHDAYALDDPDKQEGRKIWSAQVQAYWWAIHIMRLRMTQMIIRYLR